MVIRYLQVVRQLELLREKSNCGHLEGLRTDRVSVFLPEIKKIIYCYVESNLKIEKKRLRKCQYISINGMQNVHKNLSTICIHTGCVRTQLANF